MNRQPKEIDVHQGSPDGTVRRWSWMAAGMLLLVAAATAGCSTWLHWLPCRGSMFEGWFAAPLTDNSFTDACLVRMDRGSAFPFPTSHGQPWTAELGVAAQVCAPAALLVLIAGLGWQWPTKLAAVSVSLTSLALVVASLWLMADPAHELGRWSILVLLALPELAALVTLIQVFDRERLNSRHTWRLAIALWGVSAFGLFHLLGENAILSKVSEADWDATPGAGYLTALTLAVGAAAALTGFSRRRVAKADRTARPLFEQSQKPAARR